MFICCHTIFAEIIICSMISGDEAFFAAIFITFDAVYSIFSQTTECTIAWWFHWVIVIYLSFAFASLSKEKSHSSLDWTGTLRGWFSNFIVEVLPWHLRKNESQLQCITQKIVHEVSKLILKITTSFHTNKQVFNDFCWVNLDRNLFGITHSTKVRQHTHTQTKTKCV